MNKKILLSLILLLILLPNILAIDFEIKDTYSQGETLITKISGTFVEPIFKEDILFYRDHVRIPFDFEFAKIEGDYYLYAQLLGKIPGNYSIRIEEAKYIKFGQEIEGDVRSNFTISNNFSEFSVSKGFIQVEEDFSLDVLNLQDYELKIFLDQDQVIVDQEEQESEGGLFETLFGGESENPIEEQTGENNLTISPGETKTIDFDFNYFEDSSFSIINLDSQNTSYQIYVFVEEDLVNDDEEQRFRFQPDSLNFSISTDTESQRILYLENYGNGILENITLTLSDSLKDYIILSKENIDELEDNSTFKLTLNITSLDEDKLVQGYIEAEIYEGEIIDIPIAMNILKGYIPSEENNNAPLLETCEEKEGFICKDYEECSEETVSTKTGSCCLTECNQKEASSKGKLIGWLIIIFLVGFVIWFIKTKYFKSSGKINLLKIAKGKR
jgi:hypothetical protein